MDYKLASPDQNKEQPKRTDQHPQRFTIGHEPPTYATNATQPSKAYDYDSEPR
jgi:hypothetical protein